MMISDDLVIPTHAKLELGGAELKFLEQRGRKVFFQHVSGVLPTCGRLRIS